MRLTYYISFLIFFSSISFSNIYAQQNDAKTIGKEQIKAILNEDSDLFRLYSDTYHTLINRMESDGYLPESLTGAYKGMYPRTVGAYAMLMSETGRYSEAEKSLKYILDAMLEYDQLYVPHVVVKSDGKSYIMDDQFQTDAHAHIVLGWARLASARGITPFEKETWTQVKTLLNRMTDRTLFLYGGWSIEPGLVHNVAFEHSRDFRMWDAFDLLTQSFVGAALSEMSQIAEQMGDNKQASTWRDKERILSEGINKHLVVDRDGLKTYAEMFIPNSDGGVPYMGMGWVCFSPIAAGWEGADHQVMKNTMSYMEKNYLQKTNGIYWMPTDIFTDGVFVDEVIGKGIGWELDFAQTEENYKRVNEILQLIKASNVGKSVYMEFAWLEGDGFTRNSKVTKSDVNNKMKTMQWVSRDAGNGEQNTWFCWAMARLRKSLGLSAEPKPTADSKAISVSNRNGLGKRITNIHSSSGWASDDENAFKLLNGNKAIYNFTDKWCSNNTFDPWVILSLSDYYNINKIEFRDALSVENLDNIYNCDSYKVYVSTTGVENNDWIEIISETNVKDKNIKSFVLEIPVEARYIKFAPKSGAPDGNRIWIYGFDAYGDYSRPIDRGDVVSVGKSIVSSHGFNSIRETPANLLDGMRDNGSWAFQKSDKGNAGWVIIDLESEHLVDGFSLIDGSDWINGYNVYVSKSNLDPFSSQWTRVTSANFGKEEEHKTVRLDSPIRCRFIKLEIPADTQSGWTRIKEFEVYGKKAF